MKIRTLKFGELSTDQLYEILQLRARVFVVEQECAYLDPDGKDRIALHILGYEQDSLAAYTRIFGPGDYAAFISIGRVVVHPDFRGRGHARTIMKTSIGEAVRVFGPGPIELSAQSYLRRFYREMGFSEEGTEYLEDGIPHIRMILHSGG